MRLLLAISVAGFLLFPLTVCATIINIPNDYPTIQEGIDASSDGDTVLVQPNVYYENINFNGHNVVLASLFLTTGDTIYVLTTVIDGDRAGSVITFETGEDSTAQVVGFTIRNGHAWGNYPYFCGGGITCWNQSNPSITNNVISDNWAWFCGGGLFCLSSNPTIRDNSICDNTGADHGGAVFCLSSNPTINNNTIRGNWGYCGGGIYCYEGSSPTISNNTISRNSSYMHGGGLCCSLGSNAIIGNNMIRDNTTALNGGGISCYLSNPKIDRNLVSGNAAFDGGGIHCWDSNPVITNNTITGNVAGGRGPEYGYGGGVCCVRGSIPRVVNTIFWADTAVTQGNEIFVDSLSHLMIIYSNIEGGWPGTGNIDIDPLFRDPENGDFHLQSITYPDCGGPGDSPCIDAGDSSFVDSLISCDWGLGTGAYGGGDSLQIGIPEQQENIPTCFYLSQNYPNPFNAATVISYQLPTDNSVRLDIYNLLGQRIATLVDSKQQTGYRSVLWDASDVSSGLYFYKLTAGDVTETRRMILAK